MKALKCSTPLFLFGLLAACGGSSTSLDELEDLTGKAEGYTFNRKLLLDTTPATIGGKSLSGNFDASKYVAHWFQGEGGERIDIAGWTRFSWRELAHQTVPMMVESVYDLSLMLFQARFSPEYLATLDETQQGELINNPDNWTLVRVDQGGPSSDGVILNDFGRGTERMNIILPKTGYYLVMLLSTQRAYDDQIEYVLDLASIEAGDTTPGALHGTINREDFDTRLFAPLEGYRLSIGDQEVFTDQWGTFELLDLYPGTYTLKLGVMGLQYFEVVIRPGRTTELPLYLETTVKPF